jgi:hypothetical protein
MLINFILFIFLQIDPSEAVKTISSENAFGALSIILIFFLAGALLFIRKNFQRQISDMKEDLKFANSRTILLEEKNEKSRTEFQTYLQTTVRENIDVIKRFTDRFDDYQNINKEILKQLTK